MKIYTHIRNYSKYNIFKKVKIYVFWYSRGLSLPGTLLSSAPLSDRARGTTGARDDRGVRDGVCPVRRGGPGLGALTGAGLRLGAWPMVGVWPRVGAWLIVGAWSRPGAGPGGPRRGSRGSTSGPGT